MKNKYKNLTFFFFSDDIEWVKQNFKFNNVYFIDWNKGNKSWEDMALMASAKHNIIANSSFSRWGAWLNTHPYKQVIAPQKWYSNEKIASISPVPKTRLCF